MPVASPHFFAWADVGEAFDAGTHNRMDEYIFSYAITQAETEQAALEIEIKNPGIDGLLAPGRPLWCWFSVDLGGGIEPQFNGRLVAIPTNLLATVITLKFVARPDDYEAQRTAIADAIRNAGDEFYDPIFIDASNQASTDAVLEAIPEDWHTDRVTLEVTTSDILVGEDGTVTFSLGEAFIDELDVQIGEAPLNAIAVDGTVPWTQALAGVIDFGIQWWGGFGSTEGIKEEWPKAGDQLAGGYSVVEAGWMGTTAVVTKPQTIHEEVNYQNEAKTHHDGDTMSLQASYSGPPGGGGGGITVKDHAVVGDPYTGTPASHEIEKTGFFIDRGGGAGTTIATSLKLGYGTNRARTEKISFTVHSALQEVLRSNADPQVPETISKSGTDVGTFMGGELSPSYFMTTRGDRSLRYLIMLAVARLKIASRIVKGTWGTTYARAFELTCRKNAALFDPRLQHGQIVGKITAYRIEGNGDSGVFKGSVTVGAAIGTGGALVPGPGTPTYCNEDYVDPPYQMYENAVIAIGGGDIGYSPVIMIPNDDGLIFPLTADQVTVKKVQHFGEFVENPDLGPPPTPGTATGDPQQDLQVRMEYQVALINYFANFAMQTRSWFELELKALDKGTFGSAATVTVSDLMLPKQYDVTSP